MRLMLICLFLTSCAAVDINKPGVRVTGLMSEQGARRQFNANTVDDGAARGDCVQQYTADGTLITTDTDGVMVNCGGYGQGGYAGASADYSRAAQQAALDNPGFGQPQGGSDDGNRDAELSEREKALKEKEKKLKADAAKLKAAADALKTQNEEEVKP